MKLRSKSSSLPGLKPIRNQRGFTLIEVVVALAILATTLYGGFFLLNRTTANTYHLRDTVLANWVATNAYAIAVLQGSESDQESQINEPVIMYGEEFLVTLSREEVSQTVDQDNTGEDIAAVSKIQAPKIEAPILTILVTKSSAPDSPLENLMVYQ